MSQRMRKLLFRLTYRQRGKGETIWWGVALFLGEVSEAKGERKVWRVMRNNRKRRDLLENLEERQKKKTESERGRRKNYSKKRGAARVETPKPPPPLGNKNEAMRLLIRRIN